MELCRPASSCCLRTIETVLHLFRPFFVVFKLNGVHFLAVICEVSGCTGCCLLVCILRVDEECVCRLQLPGYALDVVVVV